MKLKSWKCLLMCVLSLCIYWIASAIGTVVSVVTLLEISGMLITVIILCLAAVLMVKLTERVMFFPLWLLICSLISAIKNIVTVGVTLDNLIPENNPDIHKIFEIIGDVGTGLVVVIMILWYIFKAVLYFVLPLIISAIFGKLFKWLKNRKSITPESSD